MPRQDTWVTNGYVSAAVQDGSVLYIGGTFTQVGPYTGGLVAVDSNGIAAPGFPKVNGTVRAVVSDGAGGWYIGGSFTGVGGVARGNAARILSNFTVDANFNPDADNAVYALAVTGGTVYASGDFTNIGGQARNRIAALNGTTGNAAAWNPNANNTVSAVVVSGGVVYAGGFFTVIGGQTRNRIAAIDAATGTLTTWNPNANSVVLTIAVSGTTVYAGGFFTNIAGQARNRIAAINSSGGAVGWNPNANGTVSALAVSGGSVYAGGFFTTIGGQPRNRIAALNATTAAATAWNPNSSGTVGTLAVTGSTVYAGGLFTTIGGQPRNNIAALDVGTGAATAWDPNAGNEVYALAVSGGAVCMGGSFSSIGGQPRRNIAAIDLVTGAATAWQPNANNAVEALALSGGIVYAGGFFTSIGGQPRNRIAALDLVTGSATAFDPNLNDSVYALAVSGGMVFAGGDFTVAGGQPRNRIAALDAATGNATAFNPNANNSVYTLALSGGAVIAGGDFTVAGGQPRNRIAALDAATGNATAFDANANGTVYAVAVSGGTVYAGGDFTSAGGQVRNRIAALNTGTGVATAWNPGADGVVFSVAPSGGEVYAGGGFSSIGGQPRNNLASLDSATGNATLWNPNPAGNVVVTQVAGGSLYVGGYFTGFGLNGPGSIAVFPIDTEGPNAVSIVSPGAGPTNADALDFEVTFDEDVLGLDDSADIEIAHFGTAHSVVNISGGPITYTVTVVGITGDGVISLSVNTGSDVRDYAGNLLVSSVSSAAVHIDNTAPNAISITPAGTGPTNAGAMGFTVVFDEEVENFYDSLDIAIGDAGTAHTGVIVSGGPSTYAVTVIGISGDGTFTLSVNTGSDVRDYAGNPLASSVASAAILIDNTAPNVIAITPANGGPTNADEAKFTVIFDEGVLHFEDASDVLLAHSGTGHAGVGISGGPGVYEVTISGITGDGFFSLTANTGSDVLDFAGNPLASSIASSAVLIDNTAPGIAISGPSRGITNTGPVSYMITYTDADGITLTPGDIALEATGSAMATVAVDGIGIETRTVILADIIGDGSLGFRIVRPGTAFDAAGNGAPMAGPSEAVIVDNTPPEFTSVTATPPHASANETVRIRFETSSVLDGDADVLVNGNRASRAEKGVTAFVYEYIVLASDPIGPALIEIGGVDLAGNAGMVTDESALMITEVETGVPIVSWPLLLLLPAAGALAVPRISRRRLERFGDAPHS